MIKNTQQTNKTKTTSKNKNLNMNNRIKAIGVIIVVAIGVGLLAYAWKDDNTKTNSNATTANEVATTLPKNLDSLKTIDEVSKIVGVTDANAMVNFTLEYKEGHYVYTVVLTDGSKIIVEASTGEILNQEKVEVAGNKKIPAGVTVTVSALQAYQIAASRSSSPIKSIEMEVEDKKVVYKIEYKDGSHIQIDASNRAVIKSEIKGDSKTETEHEDGEIETERQSSDDSGEVNTKSQTSEENGAEQNMEVHNDNKQEDGQNR